MAPKPLIAPHPELGYPHVWVQPVTGKWIKIYPLVMQFSEGYDIDRREITPCGVPQDEWVASPGDDWQRIK
jgi:hypothetical protein